MNLRFPQLAAATGAIILVYCAIRDINPKDLVTNVLQGKGLPAAGSGSSALPAKTPVVYPDGTPTGGYINGQGQYIPPTDSTQPAPTDPNLVPKNESYVAPYTTPYQVTSV